MKRRIRLLHQFKIIKFIDIIINHNRVNLTKFQ